MTEITGNSMYRQTESRNWMKYFAIATACSAIVVILCFVALLWLAGSEKPEDPMRVSAWQNVAAGLALLALPVAFAGSYVVIKIAQLATNLSEKQQELMDQQNLLFSLSNQLSASQVRLQAHQLLHDDLAVAAGRAEAVIAWRLAWRRALNRFWGALEEATRPPPPDPAPSPRGTAVGDEDVVAPGAAFPSKFEMTHEEQVKQWEASCDAARATASDSLRALHRLAQEADAIRGLDACLRDQLRNETSSFAILSFLRPCSITSAADQLAYESFVPTRASDLLPDPELLRRRLKNWRLKGMGEDDLADDAGPTAILLSRAMTVGDGEGDERLRARGVRENHQALRRLFGRPGALYVTLLAAVADRPEAHVIADTPHAAEHADRVAEHVRSAFARAGIDDPLLPAIEDWGHSFVAYVRQDPRRLSPIPEEEWPIANQEGWERSLSAEACRIISGILSDGRPSRDTDASET